MIFAPVSLWREMSYGNNLIIFVPSLPNRVALKSDGSRGSRMILYPGLSGPGDVRWWTARTWPCSASWPGLATALNAPSGP